jgi:hypothetical protein
MTLASAKTPIAAYSTEIKASAGSPRSCEGASSRLGLLGLVPGRVDGPSVLEPGRYLSPRLGLFSATGLADHSGAALLAVGASGQPERGRARVSLALPGRVRVPPRRFLASRAGRFPATGI